METKEILETIGLDPAKVTTKEQLLSEFDTKFITKEAAIKDETIKSKITGEVLSSVEVNFKRDLKEIGIELSADEIKGKKLSEVQKIGISKAKDFFESQINDLKTKAGQGNDEKVKEKEKELEAWQKKFSDLKGLHDSTTNEFNSFKQNTESEKRNSIKSSLYEDTMSKIKWKDKSTDLEMAGIRTIINSELSFDLNENNQLDVFDKNNQRLKSKVKAGEWMTPKEAIEEIVERNNMIQKNPLKTGTPFEFMQQRKDQKPDPTEAIKVNGSIRKLNLAGRTPANK